MTSSTRSPKNTTPVKLPDKWAPSCFDVICGRGSIAQQHEGNKRLKMVVQSRLAEYNASRCKFQKSKLVSSIVETIQRASRDGGFVKFVDDGWVRVNDRHCREKVGQMFRDALHTKYKSSTKAKSKLRRQRSGEDDQASDGSSRGSAAAHNEATKALHQLLQQPQQIPSSVMCLQRSSTPPSPIMSHSKKLPTSERVISFLELNDLPDFHPEPIGEESMENLFNLDFPSAEPSPFWCTVSDDNMDRVCDFLFEQL